MRKLLYVYLMIFLLFASFCYAQWPESVKNQSRKDAVESDAWKEFDKSGEVKFLQVQNTASASERGSGVKLDGSIGERLVEIVVSPSIGKKAVEWTLENKGKSTIWVVAAGGFMDDLPISISAGSTTTLESVVGWDRYTYIVVDNEGGKKASLDIKAKCGETAAKTARGKSMFIIWF